MLRPSLVPMPPPKFTTRDPLSFALREGSQSGLHGKPCSAFDLLYIVIVIPLMDKIPALAQILHIYIYMIYKIFQLLWNMGYYPKQLV